MLTLLSVLLMYNLLIIATADLEHLQHAGHVHTSHEVDGKHNVEFDHEAILGEYSLHTSLQRVCHAGAAYAVVVCLSVCLSSRMSHASIMPKLQNKTTKQRHTNRHKFGVVVQLTLCILSADKISNF